MTQDEFDKLEIGDIVRGRMSGDAFMITKVNNIEGTRIAMRMVTLTQPDEWDLISKLNAETGDKDSAPTGEARDVSVDSG